MLTPCSRFVVAKVWRNLWRYHLLQCGPSEHLFPCLDSQWPQLRFPRRTILFNLFSNFLSGLPWLVGKIRSLGLGPVCRALYSLRAAINNEGTGISRSSLSLGLKPRCFFAVTRTHLRRESTSLQVVYRTSLSRSPVSRKNM